MNSTTTATTRLLLAFYATKCIGQSTEDETLTDEVCERHDIQERRARVTKQLLVGPTKPIRSVVGAIRRYHTRETFQGFGESRLLPTAANARWNARMEAYHDQFRTEVDRLYDRYEIFLAQEQDKLASSFNLHDYPSKETLRSHFQFTWGVAPLARPDDVQLDLLAGDAIETIRAEHEQRLAAAVAEVESRSIEQGLALLQDLAEELSKPKPTLIDTPTRKGVVPRLREFLDRIPERNLTGNPVLSRMRSEITEKLQLSTTMLRDHVFLRQETAATAKSILASFKGPGRKLDLSPAEPQLAAAASA
jgi:hypothetical protein